MNRRWQQVASTASASSAAKSVGVWVAMASACTHCQSHGGNDVAHGDAGSSTPSTSGCGGSHGVTSAVSLLVMSVEPLRGFCAPAVMPLRMVRSTSVGSRPQAAAAERSALTASSASSAPPATSWPIAKADRFNWSLRPPSSAVKKRPGFERVMQLAHAGKCRTLVVWASIGKIATETDTPRKAAALKLVRSQLR